MGQSWLELFMEVDLKSQNQLIFHILLKCSGIFASVRLASVSGRMCVPLFFLTTAMAFGIIIRIAYVLVCRYEGSINRIVKHKHVLPRGTKTARASQSQNAYGVRDLKRNEILTYGSLFFQQISAPVPVPVPTMTNKEFVNMSKRVFWHYLANFSQGSVCVFGMSPPGDCYAIVVSNLWPIFVIFLFLLTVVNCSHARSLPTNGYSMNWQEMRRVKLMEFKNECRW